MITASAVLTYLLQTASFIGIGLPQDRINHEEVHCLAENVYFEARGESPRGMYAVAHATLNRVNHPGFPDTVCKVVRQKTFVQRTGKFVCAFSWNCDRTRRIKFVAKDGSANTHVIEDYKTALEVALHTLHGDNTDVTNGAISFHNPNVSSPDWASRMRMTVRIGNHAFYK